MKAVVCKAWGLPDTLVVEDVATPQPGPGEVLIDIRAASVNYPDVLMIQKKYQVQPTLPFIPGSEVAGVVSALGEGVTSVKLGDRVIAFVGLGGFAEQVVAKAAGLVAIPQGLDDAVAAGFTLVYGTSHHAVIDRGCALCHCHYAHAGHVVCACASTVCPLWSQGQDRSRRLGQPLPR